MHLGDLDATFGSCQTPPNLNVRASVADTLRQKAMHINATQLYEGPIIACSKYNTTGVKPPNAPPQCKYTSTKPYHSTIFSISSIHSANHPSMRSVIVLSARLSFSM